MFRLGYTSVRSGICTGDCLLVKDCKMEDIISGWYVRLKSAGEVKADMSRGVMRDENVTIEDAVELTGTFADQDRMNSLGDTIRLVRHHRSVWFQSLSHYRLASPYRQNRAHRRSWHGVFY